MSLPKRYDPRSVEAKWRASWKERGIYRSDPAGAGPIFSIDTPPPTVSGPLHVGSVFSYTHTDIVARFQRMRGKNVFYPMGWDDNGLPTERRVQNLHKVSCSPHLPYDPDSRSDPNGREVTPISRRNFLELCAEVTAQDEKEFEELWRRLGLSVDWTQTYATIDARSRSVSQLAFLDLVYKGEAYSADAPTVWDVDFQTAVAQAETEEREVQGFEVRLRFGIEGGGSLPVMTTRPELLGACVAVIVHPQDGRYAFLIDKAAITPGYRARVPILAHPLADPEKGTGAVMVCTFGDATDVTWWRELGLPMRIIFGRDGRVVPVEWGMPGWESLDSAAAQELHDRIAGLTADDAKRRISELLREPTAAADATDQAPLAGGPKPIAQMVKFYEKGQRPLEILLTRQWFIRLLDKQDTLLEQGRKVRWHPDFMRERYEQWVRGLKSDWCVSRQRYFGVPMPIWYPLNSRGKADYDDPILPERDQLPIDPMADTPPGFTEDQRDEPNGFTADADVLDTWATSSLTPQIAAAHAEDDALVERLYPMDMRPQAHDIIRTWAFYTITRAYMQDGRIPWRNAAISGYVYLPGRRKMSKSAGDAVSPATLMDQYGADAVRYWAASVRLGVDAAYDEAAFRVGKRLATKIFNAGKLIVGRLRAAEVAPGDVTADEVAAPLDRAHLSILGSVIAEATELMEGFETAPALETIEAWFWSNLCDNYLELTKGRAYAGDRSALAAWSLSLSAALRMLAPFLPYVTEEVWSWHHGADGESVHSAAWPEAGEVSAADGDPEVFETAVAALTQVRGHKTTARVSLRTPIETITVTGPAGKLAKLELSLGDFLEAAAVARADLRLADGADLTVHFGSARS
ncbi:MAG: valine--tRNA ligase [Planctomycetota bacterium]|jgi:valyl-tRNA synthetase